MLPGSFPKLTISSSGQALHTLLYSFWHRQTDEHIEKHDLLVEVIGPVLIYDYTSTVFNTSILKVHIAPKYLLSVSQSLHKR